MNRYYLPMEPNNRVRPFLFLLVKPDGDRTLYTLRPTAPYYYEGDHPISLDKLLRQAGQHALNVDMGRRKQIISSVAAPPESR
jgi:hypothetical protein